MFRRAEAELRSTLQMLSDIQVALNRSSIVIVVDPDGLITYINELAQEVLDSEIIAKQKLNFRSLVVPGQENILQTMFATLCQGEPWRGELQIISAGFNIRWFQTTVVPFFSPHEEPSQYISISVDITSQKEAERGLQRSQVDLDHARQSFESIVQNSADAIAIVNLNGELLRVNPAWERTYGWHSDEVVGKVMPFTLEQTVAWQESAASGQVQSKEILRTKKDGTSIYVSITISPVLDSSGELIALCGISRDITKRVENERKLNKVKQELESFIEQSADAITVSNLNGEVLRVNSAFERIFGWAASEVIGQPLSRRAEGEQSEVLGWLAQIRKGKRISALETTRQRRDGTKVHISVTASPITDEFGNIVAMSVISRDITSQVADTELLHRSEKLSLVGQMAAGVAHEIRNPMASLQGFAQLIGEQTEDVLIKKYAAIMLDEFRRINSILNELLLVAKPQKVEYVQSNLQQILHDVITLVETQANEKNIALGYHFDHSDVFVECVENELKQVFINIMKNAVEATPPGKSIGITMESLGGGLVMVRCEDTGCGIPKDHLEKLGSPFFTTKPGGTGLGLMITARIVESHGGHMMIDSEENVGTIVKVTLPYTSAMTP